MPEPARTSKSVLAALFLAVLASAARADEYTVFTSPGAPVDPAGVAATVIASGNDDVSQTVTLPFAFPYFGRLQDRITVCSNGWAAFGTTTATASNNPSLPSAAAPNAVLAPLWDDLSTGSGTVRTFTNGVAPARVFVVDWNGVQSFDGQASGLRFQIVLSEGTGVVQFAYGSGGTWSGLSYTSGIEDPTGTVAFSAAGTGNGQTAQPTGLVLFQPRTALVTGRLLRDRPVADESGLGNSTESSLAVSGVTVRAVREDTGEVAVLGRTGPDGVFALQAAGVESTDSLALEVVTEGDAGRVLDGSGAPYAYRFRAGLDADEAVQVGDVTLDAAVDGVNASIRRALNIQQALERGHDVATAAAEWAADNLVSMAADSVPALDATWVPGVVPAGGTAYAAAEGTNAATLHVAEGTSNPDAYDDDVILREYGHHVLASLSAHPGTVSGARGFAVATSEAVAWAEGFGYLFAAGVQERARLVDTVSATTAVVSDLETPPSGARGPTFPAAVAGSLWDLVDPANENEDEVEGTTGPPPSDLVLVIAHVDQYLDAAAEGSEITVRSFFDVWRTADTAEDAAARVQAARIFILHGTLPDDDAEPNDRIDEATATDGPGSKVAGRSLSPSNTDVFKVVLPGGLPQRLVFDVHQPQTSVDLTVELVNGDGDVVDSATNAGATGSNRKTVSVEPALPLDPGTYHVRVRSDDTATGQYSLSVYAPFLLATGDLPAWTVGVPFKQDLVAAGGVAPYTFVTSTNAPGMVVAENGTRLTGTPTTAGEFDVDIQVSDDAAPVNSVTAARPFLVNPAPALPALFGVAAGRDGSRLLGSGGTGAQWTPILQPTNGMTLVGGAELRLAGSSGAPTTFPISADALDSVGARLDAAASVIVVTADLLESNGAAVPGDGMFGYFLDALAGSDIDVKLRFRGSGRTPTVIDVLDDAGASLLSDGLVDAFGRKVKLRGIRAQQTGRAHLILDREDFVGTVQVDADVAPPRKVLGESAIGSSGELVEVEVDALAGATVKVDLRRSPSPTSLEPTLLEVRQPDGSLLALPTERRRGAKRAVLKFTAGQDGRYVLRITGRDGTTGPLFYKVRVRTPRKARLVLD